MEEEQNERAGFIRPKKQRETIQRPVLEHIETFIAERYAVGRDEKYVRELKKKLVVLAAQVPWKYLTEHHARKFLCVAAQTKEVPEDLE